METFKRQKERGGREQPNNSNFGDKGGWAASLRAFQRLRVESWNEKKEGSRWKGLEFFRLWHQVENVFEVLKFEIEFEIVEKIWLRGVALGT